MNNIVLHRTKQVSTNNTGWTREGLRNLARFYNIPRGRNVNDTIRNLARFYNIPRGRNVNDTIRNLKAAGVIIPKKTT
jgi:hypothetical protein